jgi:hypothetical protein
MDVGALLRLNMRDLINEPMMRQIMLQLRPNRSGMDWPRLHWFPMNRCRMNCAGCWSSSTAQTVRRWLR